MIDSVLNQYELSGEREVRELAGGMNNTTQLVTIGGHRFVLRLYDNHRDTDKVLFEHEVLLLLQKEGLPFGIPAPMRARNGQTYVRSGDGRIAALFGFIEGELPTQAIPGHVHVMGLAAGELVNALERIAPEHPPAYPPYYEIGVVHPAVSPEILAGLTDRPEFSGYREPILRLLGEYGEIRAQAESLKDLPSQIIHGDINFSNALVRDGRAAAILDFEFATRDLRAMELAVCLCDLIETGGEESWALLDAFMDGFGSIRKLTDAEIEALPELMGLRRLDVWLHFLGRWLDGLDGIDTLLDQMAKSDAVCACIRANRERIRNAARRFLR